MGAETSAATRQRYEPGHLMTVLDESNWAYQPNKALVNSGVEMRIENAPSALMAEAVEAAKRVNTPGRRRRREVQENIPDNFDLDDDDEV